jgi:flagellar assembly protein FliH
MPYANLVSFDRPLTAVAIPGQGGRFYLQSEIEALEAGAYRKGVDATRALADQQMVEFRADVEKLSDGALKKMANLEPLLVAQLRDGLPALALDLARRLLAGYEPPAEIVSRLCEEALAELFPERDNLELSVSSRDAALLELLSPEWMKRYPGLRVHTDAALAPGDCQVRSRFGLTDARQQTKLAALTNTPAS